MSTYPLVINGECIREGETFDIINPATGSAFASCVRASEADANAAVAAAKAAFPAWSQTSDEERKGLMHQLGALLEENLPELAGLVVSETGKPMQGLTGIGAGMEVGGASAWAHVTADLDIPVEVVSDDDQGRVEIHRRPLGVVASITPWNWPLMIAIWHIIPAMRAGNTVVIKPSPFAPVATTRFVELANTVLPPGVLNLVSGGPELGAVLTEHPDVSKVTFTGSTPTGKAIMKSGAGNLKRLTLELGGNDAGIVLDDVNVDEIAPQLIPVIFHNNGQTCAALKRLYVHESIYEAMCTKLSELAKELVVGNGLEESTDLGPCQNERQFNIIKEFAESARRDNGRFLCGGNPIEGDGYFFEPTLVADLSEGSKLVDEEPFGPIAPIIKYSDIEEVIARANSSASGLGGSVWSSDPARAAAIASRLECGTAWVNQHGALRPDSPFGGVKASGIGVEFGPHGLAEFTNIQTVMLPK
jgi:acyl-CoA reductase-like NAD-dependent aldehyde dehydrogenase